MKHMMESLIALQDLQLKSGAQTGAAKEEITKLRANVPDPVLAHFDRLLARGKKGIALVKNGVCTGCHLKVSSGTFGNLWNTNEIHLCATCGRYLYLPPQAETEAPKVEAVAAKVKKPRKKAKLELAAP
jgi:predicted CXXCH cytochrome family protein